MKRFVLLGCVLGILLTRPAKADPEFRVTYPQGIPRAAIAGDYRYSSYSVWRAETAEGAFSAVTAGDVLCMGACFADDYGAAPGRTYWYRFDLVLADGSSVRFGPYPARIDPEQARRLSAAVTPNPGFGSATLSVFLAGAPGSSTEAEVAMFDLQGRRVAGLHRGRLSAGITRVSWSGRSDSGHPLAAGLYLLRATTADGRSWVSRVIRSR
jgi:hypothetical protein